MTLAHKVSSKVTCNERASHEQMYFQAAFLGRLATRESVKDQSRRLTQLFTFSTDEMLLKFQIRPRLNLEKEQRSNWCVLSEVYIATIPCTWFGQTRSRNI